LQAKHEAHGGGHADGRRAPDAKQLDCFPDFFRRPAIAVLKLCGKESLIYQAHDTIRTANPINRARCFFFGRQMENLNQLY
jgi:hypothetical protein